MMIMREEIGISIDCYINLAKNAMIVRNACTSIFELEFYALCLCVCVGVWDGCVINYILFHILYITRALSFAHFHSLHKIFVRIQSNDYYYNY